MPRMKIEDAQGSLADLIHQIVPGEELVILEDDQPIAKIVLLPPAPGAVPKFGTMRGTVLSMEGFDDPLEDFEALMK